MSERQGRQDRRQEPPGRVQASTRALWLEGLCAWAPMIASASEIYQGTPETSPEEPPSTHGRHWGEASS